MESLPAEENLRAKLLRTLRVNFQQQGDAVSVKKIISLELAATQIHLKKSWLSGGEYYRKKYRDFDRVKKFWEWALFKFLDFVWGNGESVAKLLRTTLIIMLAISSREFLYLTDKNDFSAVINCLIISPSIFFGVTKGLNYEEYTLTAIYFLRLVVFGLFMSIVIKRISRR